MVAGSAGIKQIIWELLLKNNCAGHYEREKAYMYLSIVT